MGSPFCGVFLPVGQKRLAPFVTTGHSSFEHLNSLSLASYAQQSGCISLVAAVITAQLLQFLKCRLHVARLKI